MEHLVAACTGMAALWAFTDLSKLAIAGVGALLIVVDLVIWYLTSEYRAVKHSHRDIVVNEWVTKSAMEMAQGIRNKEITSEELVQHHIAAMTAVNPAINAVVAYRFAEAISEAQKKDKEVEEMAVDELPLFHGVPCTIKECFEVEGMPHTGGLTAREGRKGKTNSPAVQKMVDAGFIILGVTNVSELCMWWESNNQLYGRTNNPHDISRIVGGSSGGEGAIVAACGSPLGLGSDVGGSIRMPAFFNGVFGHKPSARMVDNTGQHPNAEREVVNYLCTGPICRHAEDLYPFLQLLHSTLQTAPLKDPSDVDLGSVTFFDGFDTVFGTKWLLSTPCDSLRSTHEQVRSYIKQSGFKSEPLILEEFFYSFDIWTSSMSLGSGKSFRHHLEEGGSKSMILELLRWIFGGSDHTFPAIVFALVEKAPQWTPARSERLVKEGIKLKEELEKRLKGNAVFLVPSFAYPAIRHNMPLLQPFSFCYTAIFNVLEMPVTQVPIGVDKNGMPLGIQVVAAHGNDHLCLAFAKALERKFGGWTAPSMLVTKG